MTLNTCHGQQHRVKMVSLVKRQSFRYFRCEQIFVLSCDSGLRDILLHQISITLKHGIRATGEPELRHYKQLVDLVDFVLDGRKAYLESIKDTDKYGVMLQQYESQRSDLIYPFGKWSY